jgi:glyceraldehyde-3-phosphate dehydrogenase (NADP+)
LGSIHLWEKKRPEVDAADAAFNNGQVWPTMKVADRIKSMTRFVSQMEATREEVVKYLMWEMGNHYLIPKRI